MTDRTLAAYGFARSRLRLTAIAALLLVLGGCQQKMAEQPYYKPYEKSEFFEDGRSARPLEPGTVHRGQANDDSPLVTGLTQEEWGRFYAKAAQPRPKDPVALPVTQDEDRQNAIGAPRFDPRVATNPKVYVDEFPFAMTAADLKRGQERFTMYCAMCHGPLGNGKGKIWERGFLKPTSFHTAAVEANEPPESPGTIPLGLSRGYARWRIDIPVRDVPVGYIFEVISKGFGGMPDYAMQLKPADRWRVAAYIKVLQLSQHAEIGKLPEAVRGQVEAKAGGKP
jgi:mono/diheme cytochrome c family protein